MQGGIASIRREVGAAEEEARSGLSQVCAKHWELTVPEGGGAAHRTQTVSEGQRGWKLLRTLRTTGKNIRVPAAAKWQPNKELP